MKALATNILFIQFVVLLALVLIDVVVAVAKAIACKLFEWGKLLDFMREGVVPYVLVWGVLAGIGALANYLAIADETLTTVTVLVDAVYALVLLRLVNDIRSKLKDLGVAGDSGDGK